MRPMKGDELMKSIDQAGGLTGRQIGIFFRHTTALKVARPAIYYGTASYCVYFY